MEHGTASSSDLQGSMRARDHLMPAGILEDVRSYQAAVDEAIAAGVNVGITLHRPSLARIAKDLKLEEHWVIAASNAIQEGA